MTHKQDFYRNMFQTKCRSDDTKTFQIFGVPIGNTKITRKARFHPAALVIKYHQNKFNSSPLSSLASSFQCIYENMVVPALVNSIDESLILEKENFNCMTHFANAIMSTRRKIKGEQNLRYNRTI